MLECEGMQSESSSADELLPPVEMLYDGSSSVDEFIAFGEGFCREILVPRGNLVSSDVVLDLGCGNGGVARPLTRILESGRYEGIDVNRASIEWL